MQKRANEEFLVVETLHLSPRLVIKVSSKRSRQKEKTHNESLSFWLAPVLARLNTTRPLVAEQMSWKSC